jgi:hypothetical protein
MVINLLGHGAYTFQIAPPCGILLGMDTYILPTTEWAPLLHIIVKDAQPGDTLEVHTDGMYALAVQTLRTVGRDDLTVVQRDRAAPGTRPDDKT